MILDIGGQRVTVEDSFAQLTPEQQNATVNEIASSLAPKPDAPAEGSSFTGTLKAAGTGLAKGAIGLAGLPADLVSLTDRLISGDKAQTPNILGSEALQKGVEGYTGEFYKPKGTLEQYAQTTGEFLPAALGGPESLALRMGTRVALPAIASETAGQLTQGTAAEPYARLGAALAGGVGGAKIASARLNAPAQATIPTAEDLLKTGSRGFEAVKSSGATIDPNDAAIIAQGIKAKIYKEGARPASQPALFSELDRLEEMGKAGQRLAMGDMESVRKAINDLKMSPDGSMRTHAKTAVNEFMDLQTQVLPPDVSKTLKDAIGNWAAGKRSNTVQGKINLGDLNAQTAGSGANGDNALRQAIKQLVRPINNDIVPKAARLGFNADEIAAMNNVARGTVAGNAARYVGKAAPTGIVSGALSGGAGFGIGGPAGAIALPAVGMIAKKIGDMSTQRAVKALDSLVRSRSPLATQVAAQLPPQVVQQLSAGSRALLTALSISQGARGQQVAPVGVGGG